MLDSPIDRSSASPDRVPSSFRSNRANRQTRAPTFPGTPKPTGRLSSAATRHRSTSPKPSDEPPATLGRRHCVVRATESPYTLSRRPLRLYLLFLILYSFHCFADPVLLTVFSSFIPIDFVTKDSSKPCI